MWYRSGDIFFVKLSDMYISFTLICDDTLTLYLLVLVELRICRIGCLAMSGKHLIFDFGRWTTKRLRDVKPIVGNIYKYVNILGNLTNLVDVQIFDDKSSARDNESRWSKIY